MITTWSTLLSEKVTRQQLCMSTYLVGLDIGLPQLCVKTAQAVGEQGQQVVEERP